MAGGKGNIKPEDGKQFSKDYQPDKELWSEELSLLFLNDLIDWIKEAESNIFVEDFIFLSCDETRYKGNIYAGLPNYLSTKFTSCSKLYERAIAMQKAKLVKYGVMDKLNANMTKFTLINNHGWRDKTETDFTTKGEKITNEVDYNKLSDEVLQAIIDAKK